MLWGNALSLGTGEMTNISKLLFPGQDGLVPCHWAKEFSEMDGISMPRSCSLPFFLPTTKMFSPLVVARLTATSHVSWIPSSLLWQDISKSMINPTIPIFFILPAYINITATAHTFRASQATFNVNIWRGKSLLHKDFLDFYCWGFVIFHSP